VREAKSHPNGVSYGTPGIATGNHLTMELLMQATGVQLQHIPYKGIDELTTAVLGGHIDVGSFSVSPSLLGIVQAGDLRALGIPARERSPIAPDIATFVEQGYPGVVGGTWFGFVMHADTPREIVDRLNREIDAVLALPDVSQSLAKAGMTPRGGTPEQFRQHIASEIEKWGNVIKASNITVQ